MRGVVVVEFGGMVLWMDQTEERRANVIPTTLPHAQLFSPLPPFSLSSVHKHARRPCVCVCVNVSNSEALGSGLGLCWKGMAYRGG